MRILYDATPLLLRSAGVKNYHHALLRRLLAAPAEHSIELFPYLEGLTTNRNQGSNYPSAATAWRLAGVLAANYLRLPFASRVASRADLFHVTPHLQRPPREVALSAMVHDATPLTMPERHTADNVRYFKIFARDVLPRLAGVLTPSEAVKRDLVERLGAAPERIRAVPHGVDEDFFETTDERRSRAAATYKLPERYLLFVGSLEPRKNLVRLTRAHRALPASLRARHPLVIVGASGWKNIEIRREFDRASNVRVVGYVERELLPAVYERAAAFAFPSLDEGFGMPLLEAMAAGTPVLTSNVSAMPEVVGECGVLVDPLDVDAIRDGLRRILEDDDLARGLSERGRRRAAGFTWELCADRTLDFFRSLGRNSV